MRAKKDKLRPSKGPFGSTLHMGGSWRRTWRSTYVGRSFLIIEYMDRRLWFTIRRYTRRIKSEGRQRFPEIITLTRSIVTYLAWDKAFHWQNRSIHQRSPLISCVPSYSYSLKIPEWIPHCNNCLTRNSKQPQIPTLVLRTSWIYLSFVLSHE